MSYCGQSAIDFLVTQIALDEPGASSHWRLHHKDFAVKEDGAFSGLSGFGGSRRPYRGARHFAHRAFQHKYRRMGRNYPEFDRLDRTASSVLEKQDRAYSLDVLRQTITLAFLKHHIPRLNQESVVGVIGDGFASMTTLLLASGLAKQIVLVNLTKTLLVDLAYFQRWAGDETAYKLRLVVDAPDMIEALDSPDVSLIAIQASNHALLQQAPMDLVINIVSMQEMDPPVVAAYFDDLRLGRGRGHTYFYCCNREEKRLPDGTVTRFADYPWHPEDHVMIDAPCPWHQQYYTMYPPFYRNYDGPIRHRLVKISNFADSAASNT